MTRKTANTKCMTRKTANTKSPTLTLIIEYDNIEEFSSVIEGVKAVIAYARQNGSIVSAKLENLPNTVDCRWLDW